MCDACGGTFRGALRAARKAAEQSVMTRLQTAAENEKGIRLSRQEVNNLFSAIVSRHSELELDIFVLETLLTAACRRVPSPQPDFEIPMECTSTADWVEKWPGHVEANLRRIMGLPKANEPL